MPKNVNNKEAEKQPLLFRRNTNGNQKMVARSKKEKERKKLVRAAKELESRADPSLPKKRLPKNGVVK